MGVVVVVVSVAPVGGHAIISLLEALPAMLGAPARASALDIMAFVERKDEHERLLLEERPLA